MYYYVKCVKYCYSRYNNNLYKYVLKSIKHLLTAFVPFFKEKNANNSQTLRTT